MNDRFKFRAWHKEYKRMVDVYKFGQDMGVCEWVWHSNIYPTEDGEPVLNDWGAICERQEIITKSKLINCELMQCTGLKDKNGELIFEGDIVRSENFFGIVEFGKYRVSYDSVNLGFYIKWGKKQSELRKDIFYWHETYGLKVVGNIHEDVDEYNLLKTKLNLAINALKEIKND